MSFKNKLILVLLSFITIGIYYFVISKKKVIKPKTELSIDTNISLDLSKFVLNLGTIKNIKEIDVTQNKLKIIFWDKNKIKIDNLKNTKGISGIFISTNAINLIVGKSAKAISNKIKTKMNK